MHGSKISLAAKKQFGQHFLHDAHTVARILAEVDYMLVKKIVEVGPGRGALTHTLYKALHAQGRACDLVLIELDRDLLTHLTDTFPEATIINADACTLDWRELLQGASWALVSNLPYNAGTAILNGAWWNAHPPTYAVVMLQKEVGERILARPPHMSALGVALQLRSRGKRVCMVLPGSFIPPPKVDSLVLRLDIHAPVSLQEAERVMAFARVGFAHPRKQLQSTFARAGYASSADIRAALEVLGKSEFARPGELGVDDWVALARIWYTSRRT